MSEAKCKFPEAYEICKQFSMNEEQMNEVVSRLTKEIDMGLYKDTHQRAIVKCFITYVQELPTGKERGKFLALDLGGSNFCIYLIDLKCGKNVEVVSHCYTLCNPIKRGTGKRIFEYVANCLANFCEQHKVAKDNLKLGFIFSFPCSHTAINKAVLVNWTKGFQCTNVEGKNVVRMLQKAIDERKDIRVRVVALLNDTTGVLMSCAHTKANCLIGLIVGNGCNACYVEKTDNAEMFPGDLATAKPNMVVNCEWSTFGDNGALDFVRNPFDKAMDSQTPDPMVNTYEKCIVGTYLGEIVRQIVVNLMEKGALFKGQTSQLILQQWKFESHFIDEIESEPADEYRKAAMVMDQLGIQTKNEKDLACLRYICESVTTRSAKLVACGLVCLIKKMNVKDLSIGIDGSIYRFHPRYEQLLAENLKLLLKCTTKFELVSPESGSGVGAALISAACTCRSS